jgi:hypothetical protein
MAAPLPAWGPIDPFTMFVAIRFSVHFNKRGFPRPVAQRTAACHRIMAALVDSMGGEAKGPGVVSHDPTRRKLEGGRKAMADIVAHHCRTCSDFRQSACRGVTDSQVLYMPARKVGAP